MKRIALTLFLALLLASLPVLADVQIGDRGEEVRYLQWLLIQSGWLFSSADGVFGPRTEEAVRNYQRYKGYEQTGVADYWLMEQIDHDRIRLGQEHYGTDYYEAYDGEFVPPFPSGPDVLEGGYAPANWCRTAVLPSMIWRETCDTHMPLLDRDCALTKSGDPGGYAEAAELWRAEFFSIFEQWIVETSADYKLNILASLSAWNACFGEQQAAMYMTWNDPNIVEQEMDLMLKNCAEALCETRYGTDSTDPDMIYHATQRENTSEACLFWAEGIGVDYMSPCREHAPLCAREYEWIQGGAKDDMILEDLITDWDQALLALYDRWISRCDENAAESVRNASANFYKALATQDVAIGLDRSSSLAKLRVVQFECARLCELLNHL